MNRKNRFHLIVLTVFLLLPFFALPGCSEGRVTSELRDIRKPVDYSQACNWVVLPDGNSDGFEADLFYVYPTLIAQRDFPYMDWSDKTVRDKVEWYAEQQTGIFKTSARIFAPYYRQCEFYRVVPEINERQEDRKYMKLGLEDIRSAFRYYMKHYNNGRPFILLGHSQGSSILLELMRSEWKDPAVSEKMVAAYLIGFPRMPKTFPEPYLKTARGADDTGVIITYNTEAPGVKSSVFTGPGTYCINPLNWRTDSVPADSSLNLGAVLFGKRGVSPSEYPEFCGAVINPETGALVVTKGKTWDPGKKDTIGFGSGVYHAYDLYYFYRNLEENAKVRIRAFQNKRKKAE